MNFLDYPKKIFWHIKSNFLGFWVVGNKSYPVGVGWREGWYETKTKLTTQTF